MSDDQATYSYPTEMDCRRQYDNGVERGRIEGGQACEAGHADLVHYATGDAYRVGWHDGSRADGIAELAQGFLAASAEWAEAALEDAIRDPERAACRLALARIALTVARRVAASFDAEARR